VLRNHNWKLLPGIKNLMGPPFRIFCRPWECPRSYLLLEHIWNLNLLNMVLRFFWPTHLACIYGAPTTTCQSAAPTQRYL